ncbi:sensor histidine kinase [Caproiciproducens sp. MSJ-32]|uniref:sensor histidine kinase n=1 Tax=Caproiciproducens sp. MSJ-32 TaxID=2841527 RepID=UPI001C10333D|nr:HAMP domain-containing sensor histidine kinase [Caproiciproducens sp. MSJ-32]MBU5455509.1 HAMP domain-containing histidine kinase [Caproiciproducens sp. MSJ-32]
MINDKLLIETALHKNLDIDNYVLTMELNNAKEDIGKIITELIEKETLQENFLLNITHDLRSHLSVILSVIQVMNSGNINLNDKKAKDYIYTIKKNSLKMLRLINNLIDTNKLKNNYYTLNKKNIDIVSMIEGTVECIDKYAKQKNIQLIFDTNEEECIMSADPSVIDRIIMNLISNAIKFTYEDTNIYVTLFIKDGFIKISIKDEGPGIPKKDQEKIFGRYYRINNIKRENSGSGMGLDLVKYLVKSHDGTIELISEENKGCEFIVTFPIVIEEENETHEINQDSRIERLEVEFSDIY